MGTQVKRKQNSFWPEVFGAMVFPVLFVVLLWLVHMTGEFLQLELQQYGLIPRTVVGLRGILFAPLLHSDYTHLLSNSFPLLILGGFIFYFYPSAAREAPLWIYLLSGIWVWAGARQALHIGASGIVYGLAAFLFFSGVFRKNKGAIALALLVVFLYGSLVWGVLPLTDNVSWESHLFGLLAGVVCAWYYRSADLPPEAPKQEEEEEDSDLPWDQYDGPEGNPLPPKTPTIMVKYIYKENEEEDTRA